MEAIWLWIQRNIIRYITPPKDIEIIDIIQVIIIAYLIYHLFLWFKNTRAYTLLKGILLVAAFIILASVFRMQAILWLIKNLSVVAITALVIIFQPELRKALERVGHQNIITSFFSLNRLTSGDNFRYSDHFITEVVRACMDMSESKTGALIVIEEDVKLDEVAETGIEVDAVVSSQILVNLFVKNTPMHDGAVIIRDERAIAATCYLPLSENTNLTKDLGTRHRAGVGITEISDCIALIVSEETGSVAYAHEGVLHTGLSSSDLREMLHEHQKIDKRSGRIKRKEKSARVEEDRK